MSNLVRDNRFKNVETTIENMKKRAIEFSQCRSNHQIEKFIAADEYTPITRFRHVAHNSYVTMQEIRRLMIDRERKLRSIEEKQNACEKAHDPKHMNYDLDIYEQSRQIDDIEIRVTGLMKEVEVMEAICAELEKQNGKPFTNEQLQNEEPIYWRKRLASQMHRSQIGAKYGIGEGNYDSYLKSIEKPILPDSVQRIAPFNIFEQNDVAVTALQNRSGVTELLLTERTQQQ